MAQLTVQQIDITGADITFVAASTEDTVQPGDRTFVVYKNTNASGRTITVGVPGQIYGQDRPDVPIALAATSGEEYVGPLVRDLADPSDGLVHVLLDTATDVTVAAVRV